MKGITMRTILKGIAYLTIALIFIHWFTAGQDNIIEGPPECLDGTHQISCPEDE